MVTAVKKEKKMVSANEIIQGCSLKFLVNGTPPPTEEVSRCLENVLECFFTPRRIRWQGWFFEDSTILVLTITRPTIAELASFLHLRQLFTHRCASYLAEEAIPLSAPGTLSPLIEVTP